MEYLKGEHKILKTPPVSVLTLNKNNIENLIVWIVSLVHVCLRRSCSIYVLSQEKDPLQTYVTGVAASRTEIQS